jgi:hypothetical protein
LVAGSRPNHITKRKLHTGALLKSVQDKYDFIGIKRGTPYRKGHSFEGFSGQETVSYSNVAPWLWMQ